MSDSAQWHLQSYQSKLALQQPDYKDQDAFERVTCALANSPGLVTPGEIDALSTELASVCAGRGFILQGGDCAESFVDSNEQAICKSLKVLLQMAVTLTFGAAMPVVKIARIAGQYAKPRSSDIETQGTLALPSYRGDIINGVDFDAQSREPNPQRMLKAYYQSATTINLLRAQLSGGLANLGQLHQLNVDFAKRYPSSQRLQVFVAQIEQALAFMQACGVDTAGPAIRETKIYTSHEALLLPYEQAFIRFCPQRERWYNQSAHFVWIGDRTRQLDGAHVEMLRGIANPIGIKVGPTTKSAQLVQLLERLNPDNKPGRITLITRFGVDQIANLLPALVHQIQSSGCQVVWSCDPMHGNTIATAQGRKTRRFQDIVDEVRAQLHVLRACKAHPGGIHLELTGEDVTECLGGVQDLQEMHLDQSYQTQCDPRLNFDQSLELAFVLTELLKNPTSL